METGEAARDGFFDGSVLPDIDKTGYDALRQHAGRAKTTAPVLYAAGILALVALLALIKFPDRPPWTGWAVFIGNLLGIALGLDRGGGRADPRHAEFRAGAAASFSAPTPAPSASPTPLPMPQAVALPAQPVQPALGTNHAGIP